MKRLLLTFWFLALTFYPVSTANAGEKSPKINGRSFLGMRIYFSGESGKSEALFISNPYILNSDKERLEYTTYQNQQVVASHRSSFSRAELQKLTKFLTDSSFLDFSTRAMASANQQKTPRCWIELDLGVKKQVSTYGFRYSEGATDSSARARIAAYFADLVIAKFPSPATP